MAAGRLITYKPNFNEQVDMLATSTELNVLDGITSSTAELNILDGVTASAAELNIMDGVTASAAEINLVDGLTAIVTDFSSPSDTKLPTSLAVKTYADALQQGLDVKASVRVATAAALPAYTRVANVITANDNASINDGTGIDGVTTLALTNRVLIKNGAADADNGIYTITDLGSAGTPWVMTRATDADTSAKVTSGLYTYVSEGTANQKEGWVITTNDPIVLNTTALTFTQFNGAGAYTAGNGLTLSGSSFSINTAITADLSTVQTLTNKTLTSPKLNEDVAVAATATELNALTNGTDNLTVAAYHGHADVIAGSTHGFMTGADKTRLDNIATGATKVLRDRVQTVGNNSTTVFETGVPIASTVLGTYPNVTCGGLTQYQGAGKQYTFAQGATYWEVTFLFVPATGEDITIETFYA